MKTHIPLIAFTILLLSLLGCARVQDNGILCNRFTDISETHYRIETGILKNGTFDPTSSLNYPYSEEAVQRNQVLKINGKPLLAKIMTQTRQYADVPCSKESYFVGPEAFVIIDTR